MAALAFIGGGFLQIFKTNVCFQVLGPFNPMAAPPATEPQSQLLQVMGGFMVVLGCMLTTVRWNTINGKLSGLACLGCAANLASVVGVPGSIDGLSLFHVYSIVALLAGLHLMFNANPMIKAATENKDK